MLNAGIQSARSTIWNAAVVLSKFNQMNKDSTKVISEVHNATLRALRATTSGSPRINKMNAAPTSGRNVVSDRMGQPAMISLASPYQPKK